MDHSYYVLHSPYPDKTWRGIEKCLMDGSGMPRLFGSEEDANRFSKVNSLPEFITVEITVTTPSVRKSRLNCDMPWHFEAHSIGSTCPTCSGADWDTSPRLKRGATYRSTPPSVRRRR